MKWLKRNDRSLTRISLLVDGKTITFPVSERAADAIDRLCTENQALRQANVRLEHEADEIAQATSAMADANHREHERQERLYASLCEINESLRKQIDGHLIAIKELIKTGGEKQAELDRLLADYKRLDGENVQLAAELLEVSGRLASAEEEVAGLKLARTS